MVRASVELNGGLSVAAIIARLDRPDWILWLLARTGTSKRQIVKLACVAARRALRFFPKDDDRPEKAIISAERWVMSPCDKNKKAAADAAAAAYAAAAYAAAADAAADAADAADAAYAAAYAAAAAAAYAAAYAATYAARAAADAAAHAASAAYAAKAAESAEESPQ